MRDAIARSGYDVTEAAFIVQPMARPGVEVIVGSRVDPVYGPVVLVGAGGIYAELLGDTIVAPAPVSIDRAAQMVRGLKISAVLEGARGGAKYDVDALSRTIATVSKVASSYRHLISELECNPVIVHTEGCTIIDGLATVGEPHDGR
jgi:hypothetical protein